MQTFEPNARPVLIGSMPLKDHAAAADLVTTYTPEIPVWVQLPALPNEGMVDQFLPGMPGVVTEGDRRFVDLSDDAGSQELLAFYEEVMAAEAGELKLEDSRFALGPEAPGFGHLVARCQTATALQAVKGQVTGPITFATSVANRDGQAIFYDPQALDAAIKLLTLKARYQVQQLSRFGKPVIIFIDEPALAGFGSSEMISITQEQIIAALAEIADGVHAEGGLVAVHVCANTDWAMILRSPIDFVNFDAYGFFDRFILFRGRSELLWPMAAELPGGSCPPASPKTSKRPPPKSWCRCSTTNSSR